MHQVQRSAGVRLRLLARDAALRFPRVYARYQLGELERFRRRINPSYEAEIPALARVSRGGREFAQIVDIGSNFGQSAWAFAHHFPDAQIYAFEANPQVADRCRTLLGTKVRSVDALAIGRAEGTILLKTPIYRGVPFPGLASTDESAIRCWFNPTAVRGFNADLLELEAVACAQVRLDSLGLRPDLLKIDVEGAELEVLEGALATIGSARPVILVECSGTAHEVAALLVPNGYVALELQSRRWRPSLGQNLNQLFVPIDHPPSERALRSAMEQSPTERGDWRAC